MKKTPIKSCLGCLAGFFAVSLLLVLAACTAREDTQRLERLLAEADSMNRHYVPFTTDSAMLQAVALADRHGTNTDRVRARYLLGCAYRDMGEAPQALDAFHQAIDVADTTSNDCDFLLLAKIHGQAGDLFSQQGLSRNSIEEFRYAEHDALRARDTLFAIFAYAQTSSCYFNLYDYDSTIYVSEHSRRMLLERGDTGLANAFVGPQISVLLVRNRFAETKPLLDLYEKHSVVSDTAAKDPHFQLLHYYKGLYALGVARYNEADNCFRQLIKPGVTDNTLRKGYLGLFHLYSKTENKDSCIKYGAMYFAFTDSINRTRERHQLHTIQGLYNYQRHRHTAEMAKRQSENYKLWLIVCSLSFLVVVLLSGFTIYFIRLLNARRIDALSKQYVLAYMEYQRLKLAFSTTEGQNDILRKRLEQVEAQLAEMQEDKKHPNEWALDDDTLSAPIIIDLHTLAAKSRRATDDEFNELDEFVTKNMPGFIAVIQRQNLLVRSKEYYTCILIRLRFSLAEICCLLNVSSQTLNTMRRRMYRKFFGEAGGAKEFDQKVRQL